MPESQILLPNQKIEELFITIDLNLPQDTNELSRVEETINKLKTKVAFICDGNITDDLHEDVYEEVVVALDKVGKLSEPAFGVEDEIENIYTLKYPHNPAFAKLIWYAHYEEVQHPYSLLKNRCFRMLEMLDDAYQKKFKRTPPNWEI